MDVRHLCGLLFAVGSLALLVNAQPTEEHSAEPLRVWKCPPGKPYWPDDGFGPYAPSWPTYGVICKYAPDAPGAGKRAALPDSTLFLLAAPHLQASNLIDSIPHAARFATACRSDARGRWVRFAPPPAEPHFVLVEPTGGNCGDKMRIFSHGISYDSPHVGDTALQDHTFEEVFSRGCVTSVGLRDLDGDSLPELVVEEMLEWGTSRPESKYGYRVIKKIDGEFQVVRDISPAKMQSLEQLEKL